MAWDPNGGTQLGDTVTVMVTAALSGSMHLVLIAVFSFLSTLMACEVSSQTEGERD